MASNGSHCHHCGEPIKFERGGYHCIGIDIGQMPPPTIYACGDCWRAQPHILGDDGSVASSTPVQLTIQMEQSDERI